MNKKKYFKFIDMSCTPTEKNLAIYFQKIKPIIFPNKKENTILFGTTSATPSYVANNRVWNFVCNGTFIDNKVTITFDATELIKECNYNINFEGDVYGQLTLNNKDFQLQKYVKVKLLNKNGKNYAVQFLIIKPECLSIKKITTFYFNIFWNDSSCSGISVQECCIQSDWTYLNITNNGGNVAFTNDTNSSWNPSNMIWTINKLGSESQITLSSDVSSSSFPIQFTLNNQSGSTMSNLGFYVTNNNGCGGESVGSFESGIIYNITISQSGNEYQLSYTYTPN